MCTNSFFPICLDFASKFPGKHIVAIITFLCSCLILLSLPKFSKSVLALSSQSSLFRFQSFCCFFLPIPYLLSSHFSQLAMFLQIINNIHKTKYKNVTHNTHCTIKIKRTVIHMQQMLLAQPQC